MFFLSSIIFILFFTLQKYPSIGFVPYEDDCHQGFTQMFKPAGPIQYYLIIDCSQVTDIKRCINYLSETVHPELDFVNFDDFAKKYVECIASNFQFIEQFRINVKLDWIDLYGLKEELQTPVHKGMHVRASVRNLEYKQLERTFQENPEILLIQWVHNNQSEEEISVKISEEVEKTVVTSYSVMHGIGTSIEIEWDAAISGSISAEYSFEKETEKSIETKKTFQLEDTITVPANTSVKVMWQITEAKVKQEWTADIRISGWIAFKFEGGDIWFLPVGDMGYYFREYFTKIDFYTLEFKAKGTESAPETVDSQVYTWQFELQKDLPCLD